MSIRVSIFRLTCLLLIFVAINPNAHARQAGESKSAWRAAAKVDRLAVYSEVSSSSRVVGTLAKGDAVKINLEIVGADGTWYGISRAGESEQMGYVQGGFIETEQPLSLANWMYKPPPEPVETVDEAPEAAPKSKVRVPFAKDQVSGELQKFFASKFGRALPISAFGQSALHNRLGFDHRNGIDVALHPDSSEGRVVVNFLRARGIPFIAFRQAIPGIATGPHIHVGNPSPRR